ncbi:hypothetical protein IQ247_00120 [Plectonema cf. radiosum LEGE 06105]|uniref:Uncharacterized protein n=1 Tax=Plectonema cf. radiosum LEGE 06105 TaxID=945769 RepID=A0A8J7JSN8_9CYAN|nr:hypothetical protein [Plectonema radiosum]MBE9211135.1 hypothetical protein [Plectonema cf. radiosum LEGE 06105]
MDIPFPVSNYLVNFLKESRSLAYLFVNKDGCLSSWGGNLTEYGVNNLQQGENASQQIFFLEGLLPLDDFPLFLPCIQTNNGICADVHLFPEKDGDWVLLLDATWDEMQIFKVQQQVNSSRLMQRKS